MKTSGVPNQTPPAASKATSDKPTPKADSKPQKEFKEVLDSDTARTPQQQLKGKFPKMPLKGPKPQKGQQGQQQLTGALSGKKQLGQKGEKQDLQEGILKK